jgi:ribose transport system substrate-binding protein
VMMLPRLETRMAIQGLADTVEKRDTARFVDLSTSDSLPGTPFAERSNVADFTAEY